MDMIGWLVAFVILIGIEAATMALTTIWFASKYTMYENSKI